MGRLTLNVLLSFAQFEREVIGERISDKFAASSKKGMWPKRRPVNSVSMSTSLRRGSETRRNLCGKNVELDRQAFIQQRINEAQKEARKLLGDGATAHSRANRPDHQAGRGALGQDR